MMLVCKTVSNMEPNRDKYDRDILTRTNNICVLDMQEMYSTPYKCGILLSNSNTFIMLVESSW